MTGAVYARTPRLKLGLIEFNFPNWADDANLNTKIIDAAMQTLGITISGPWTNNTAYTIGELVVDPQQGTLWRAQETHTSSLTGTMADERLAFPMRWIATTALTHIRGEWMPDTMYYQNDIVHHGTRWGVVTTQYISSDTFEQDTNDGNIVVFSDSNVTALIADTPPTGALHGHLWWESDTANLFVRYNDGDSQQWVQISGPQGTQGAKGDTGATGAQGLPGPVGPVGPPFLRWACGDEVSPMSVGTGKVTDRMPYDYEVTEVRASLNVAQTAGAVFTVDMQWWNPIGGVWASVFSTLLTFDNGELTTKTATIAAVLSKTTFFEDDMFRFDVTQIGDSTAKGLKVTLFGHQL
jgi:hypothetical protein